MIDKKFELIAGARKQAISWDRCFFVDETYTFSYLVSKNFHDYSVIIHLWKLLKRIYAKYIENQGFNKHQYCFPNISATKALILIKFDTWAHKIVRNHQKKFRKDPCTYGCTRRVNVHARDETCTRTFTPRVRPCVHGSSGKYFQYIFTIFWT